MDERPRVVWPPFNPADGLVVRLVAQGVLPHGSNAWRRYFRTGNETESPKRTNAAGFATSTPSRPRTASSPSWRIPNFLATFQPGVVAPAIQFQLDVSNVCHQRTFKFETTFECNAAPALPALTSQRRRSVPREAGD